MSRKEFIMAEINKTNTSKNVVELQKAYRADGTAIENIVIDGRTVGVLGSVSERDKAVALETLQKAIDGSDNVYEALMKIATVANLNTKEVLADEQIEIEGVKVLISYEAKTAYDLNGEELANCKELPDIPSEAIKAILVDRVKLALAELRKGDYDGDYDEDEDDGDYDGDYACLGRTTHQW